MKYEKIHLIAIFFKLLKYVPFQNALPCNKVFLLYKSWRRRTIVSEMTYKNAVLNVYANMVSPGKILFRFIEYKLYGVSNKNRQKSFASPAAQTLLRYNKIDMKQPKPKFIRYFITTAPES